MPRSFSRIRKQNETWSRLPDFRKKFSKIGNLCLLSRRWMFRPVASLWIESLRKIKSLFFGLPEGLLWCLKHSSISLYGEIKYKFYLDFILTCYRQATVPKMFSHIHSSPFRECSVPVSEREQNYHVLFLDVSNLWLMLLCQNRVPNSLFQNRASLLDIYKTQCEGKRRNLHLTQIIWHVLPAYK